ncbi:unnamed protein product [Heterobilharzia americana]|nr:unnamed protein product [Heterobilharzia americana]
MSQSAPQFPPISRFIKLTVNNFVGRRKPYEFGTRLVPLLHHYCTNTEAATSKIEKETVANRENDIRRNYRGKPYRPVDLATSLQYLNSDVFRNIYKGRPVWFYYRRNHRGHMAPRLTRKNCFHNGKLISSNPCPICRDEYLVLHHQHIELLKHFLNPDTLQIIPPSDTGLCRHQHKILQMEVEKARDLGTIQVCLPFYLYNYNDYYDYLPTDQLNELLKLNGQHVDISSFDLTCLPPDIQDFLKANQSIPHAVEFTVNLPKVDIVQPKLMDRYKMEEDYKALLLRRKRSRSFIIN